MTSSLVLRDAMPADFDAIARIYAHYVLHALATFEETPPDAAELRTRHEAIVAAGLPYLVAELDGAVAGYCYASPYRARSAYRHTIEDSVYIAEGLHGRGIGLALLSALIERCEAGPWRQMIAVIGNSANAGSIALHARLGFDHAGVLRAVGYKHEQWVDTVLMQRPLGAAA
jgi:L-amino acid N-acyltransferase YncA